MMKKTCLCILGLLLLGMLCVPVAGVTGDKNSWCFYIVDDIRAVSEVKLNGHGDDADYQKVCVANSLDQVSVEFDVTLGVDTSLTITKDTITRLRKEHPGWNPVLIAWGGFLTYDVDMGWMWNSWGSRDNVDPDSYLISERLKSRGVVHRNISSIGILPGLRHHPLQERYVVS